MLVPGSNRRIFTIDRHIGVVSIEAVAIGRTECIFIWCRALQRRLLLELLLMAASWHPKRRPTHALIDETSGAQSLRRCAFRIFFCTQTNAMSFLRVKYLNLSLSRFHAISFQALASQIGSLLHAYTCYGALRPFGSSILISGVDPTTKEHELYMSDPSGTTLVYIGSFEFTCVLHSSPSCFHEALLRVRDRQGRYCCADRSFPLVAGLEYASLEQLQFVINIECDSLQRRDRKRENDATNLRRVSPGFSKDVRSQL